MSTYVLSFPRPGFRPLGAATSDALTAQRAYQQWLELCDHITRAGGRILVVDADIPVEATSGPSTTEQADVYCAGIGAPFLQPGIASGPLFLRARSGQPRHEQASFGILNADGSPRPAFLAIQSYLADQRGAE